MADHLELRLSHDLSPLLISHYSRPNAASIVIFLGEASVIDDDDDDDDSGLEPGSSPRVANQKGSYSTSNH
jgi:hypothetical protein